jgi:hypothetical protein
MDSGKPVVFLSKTAPKQIMLESRVITFDFRLDLPVVTDLLSDLVIIDFPDFLHGLSR